MTVQEKVAHKIERLREYVQYLGECRKYSPDDLKKDPLVRGAVERYLHLAAECVIDIAEIIIAERGLRKPEEYREAIEILGEAGILSGDFAVYFAPIAGFRNILVHEYAKIDLDEVYRHLQKDLPDFEKFIHFIVLHLK
ncbi:MAG: DUF86 domain-containing protein [Alphaproteobacteria bacterium]|uniref:DUF86 domain-containing protein n=1 Tax=Candidatus Nitrobium versatile TaxID=2884831 RepID=A0A953M2P1_9BACT|nr:DUF86 domain-containing protein [Candidatus Nitrobium versatile]